MFKRIIVISIFALAALIFGCIALLYTSSKESRASYDQIMNENVQNKKELLAGQTQPVQQSRTKTAKQIIFQKGPNRMQSRLISDSSELIFSKKEGELIERFNNLTCIMQENLTLSERMNDEAEEGSMQQTIRQFKANDAVYTYRNGQLEANDVEITHYLLPGLSLPPNFENFAPQLKGKAHSIRLSLFKETAMKAQGFQAIFHHWRDEE